MEKHSLIKISSSNVRGLHGSQKRQDLFHYLRSQNFEICCLHETHFTEALEPYIHAEWAGQVVFSSYTSNAKGVCILFNNNFEYMVLKSKSDGEENFIVIDLEIEGKKTTLINFYGPN